MGAAPPGEHLQDGVTCEQAERDPRERRRVRKQRWPLEHRREAIPVLLHRYVGAAPDEQCTGKDDEEDAPGGPESDDAHRRSGARAEAEGEGQAIKSE